MRTCTYRTMQPGSQFGYSDSPRASCRRPAARSITRCSGRYGRRHRTPEIADTVFVDDEIPASGPLLVTVIPGFSFTGGGGRLRQYLLQGFFPRHIPPLDTEQGIHHALTIDKCLAKVRGGGVCAR